MWLIVNGFLPFFFLFRPNNLVSIVHLKWVSRWTNGGTEFNWISLDSTERPWVGFRRRSGLNDNNEKERKKKALDRRCTLERRRSSAIGSGLCCCCAGVAIVSRRVGRTASGVARAFVPARPYRISYRVIFPFSCVISLSIFSSAIRLSFESIDLVSPKFFSWFYLALRILDRFASLPDLEPFFFHVSSFSHFLLV